MYQRHKLPRRLTLLFLGISVSLWTARVVQLQWQQCTDHVTKTTLASTLASIIRNDKQTATKGVELDPSVRNISNWFERRLKLTDQSGTVTRTCLNGSLSEAPDSWLEHHTLQSTLTPVEKQTHIATLAAIGELHLWLGADSGVNRNTTELLSGISTYVEESDEIMTSLADGGSKRNNTSVLNSLRSIGVSLVSLASGPISQLAMKTDRVRQTTRTLEAAQVKWFGLNAKKHHIMTINQQRIGCLAFCAVHRMCTESAQLPFGPVKYSPKVATSIVKELKFHGVSVIIVVVYWGWRSSLFPDEMALPVARHLASLGVDVIIGYHPNGIQGHAYMGKTLILFSLGQVLSSDNVMPYCWNKVSRRWKYSLAKECQEVHPSAREGIFQRETHTRIYRIRIAKSEPARAEYVTLPLRYGQNNIRRPIIETGHRQNWTTACGERDIHCYSCDHF